MTKNNKKINYRAKRIIKNEKIMSFSLIVSSIVSIFGVAFLAYLIYLENSF